MDMPLATTSLNRAAHRRTDEDWLKTAFASPQALVFLMQDGHPLIEAANAPRAPARLMWLGPEAGGFPGVRGRLFLGEDKAGSPVFALDMDERFDLDASPLAGAADFMEMRAAAGVLPGFDANAAATARSLFEWRRRHGFCANCGAPTEDREAGWKRVCPSCGAEHWPRTDPVAIMLAVQNDQCLLGRQANWPAGFYSCLAGYVEPGETVEQAAARELEEESGVKADPDSAGYLFCQPWPFPSSLMIGLILEARTTEIRTEQDELEDARWFTRAEARQILAGSHPETYAPPPMAVAHHILKAWAEAD